jgi:hypothetical protein
MATDVPNHSELSLLLKYLTEGKGELGEKSEADSAIHWDKFVELAVHHRVVPLVYMSMKDRNDSSIPMDVMRTLERKTMKNTMRMMQLCQETSVVSHVLTERGVRSIVLKGPAIAEDIYGDVALRTSNDLDILVAYRDVPKAADLLTEMGYEQVGKLPPNILGDQKWRSHHVEYRHPLKGTCIEIHWRLHPGPGKEPRFQELWERRRTSTRNGPSVHLLSQEDLFVFLIGHGARHAWFRLRWLADIDRMVRQPMDWRKVVRLLAKYQQSHLAGQALLLAAKLIRSPMIGGLEQTTRRKRSEQSAEEALWFIRNQVSLHDDFVPEDINRRHQRYLLSIKSTSQKLLYYSNMLYPYPIDERTLPLPRQLHLLYLILRPILWAFRQTRKGKAVSAQEGSQ